MVGAVNKNQLKEGKAKSSKTNELEILHNGYDIAESKWKLQDASSKIHESLCGHFVYFL